MNLKLARRDSFLSKIEKLLPDEEFWYLGGPMTNRPAFNFPAFDEASKFLREKGYIIASPAEFDHEKERARLLESADGENQDSEWENALARDLCIVSHPLCLGMIVIEQWYMSNGAQLETFVTDKLGKPIYELLPPGELLGPIERDKRLKWWEAYELPQEERLFDAVH